MAALHEWECEDCAMGIDEAGRGPVLGPMVYACAYCPKSSLPQVSSMGFDDSKKLAGERREELFSALRAAPHMGWAVDVVGPEELSARMLSRERTSLNTIAFESTVKLIRRVLSRNVAVSIAYVDTVGDAGKYQARLQQAFPTITFHVSKKADSLFPVVSAASVVAKVVRDQCLREWVLHELPRPRPPCGNPSSLTAVRAADGPEAGGPSTNAAGSDGDASIPRSGPTFGSGYPGDPDTKSWLLQHRQRVFGFPSLVRFSWATARTLLEEEAACVSVHWDGEEAEEEALRPAARKGTKQQRVVRFESSARQRHSFFRTRQLQQLTLGL